jgi:hypothetical protein
MANGQWPMANGQWPMANGQPLAMPLAIMASQHHQHPQESNKELFTQIDQESIITWSIKKHYMTNLLFFWKKQELLLVLWPIILPVLSIHFLS